MQQPAGKETLAQWVSLALKKALSPGNIKSGFGGAGILPLNPTTIDGQLAPSTVFENAANEEGIVAETPMEGVERVPDTEQVIQNTEDSGGEESQSDRDADPERIHVEQQPNDSGDGNSGATESRHIEAEMAAEPRSQAEHFLWIAIQMTRD